MARKEKQYHFIYKTTNLLNGKYYYGMHSTDDLNDGYSGSGKRLRRSLNKHGKENHVVEHIEFLPDRKSLIEREKEIVNLNEIAKENCMNLIVGGRGGLPVNLNLKRFHRLGGKASSKIHAERLITDLEYAKKHIEKFLERMKKTRLVKKCGYDWTDKRHTEEEKRKIGKANSVNHIGEKNSQYGTCWITNNEINKKINKNDNIPNGWKLGRIMKI
jgi:cell fate (sporulation/competence/biofilm development) regulator YlbF (YheA/YmcA/DUF963 family)